MEFVGIGEEKVDGFAFAPNIQNMLMNGGNSAAVEDIGGDKSMRFLEKQFYNRAVVIDNNRVARKHIAL